MPVTMHDVAARASVSVKTVSNVINDYPFIRDTTKARVLAAIDELGYQVNLSARSLRTGRTGIIGLAVPYLSLPYFAQLADAVMHVADARGLTVLIEQTDGSRERELEVLHGARRKMTDGLIFSPLALGNEDAGEFDVDYPLVLLGERVFGGPVDHITMQNVEGARAATEHLIDLGCRRIAAVGAHLGEVVGSAGLRLQGYAEALAARGIPYDSTLVATAGRWYRSDGAAAMDALLSSGVEMDGAVCFNDTLALGAIYSLQMRGVRVPQDVAVIGFDDIEEGRYSLPPLTTVSPGRDVIARDAVDLLVTRLDAGSRDRAPVERQVPFTIVVRGSTPQADPGATSPGAPGPHGRLPGASLPATPDA